MMDLFFQAHCESIDENFMRSFSMAIIRTMVDESSKYNINAPAFEKKLNLLRTYLGDRRSLEMQVSALHGMQKADRELEHPKGEWYDSMNRRSFCFCLLCNLINIDYLSLSSNQSQNYLRTCSASCSI